MLLFKVGNTRWALSATEVQTIIPLIALQKTSTAQTPKMSANAALLNWLNYHGEMMPAIDISMWIVGSPAPQILSTRIAILESQAKETARETAKETASVSRLGLILDSAGETSQLFEGPSLPAHMSSQSPLTQALWKDSQGNIIQQLALAPLFERVFGLRSELLESPTVSSNVSPTFQPQGVI